MISVVFPLPPTTNTMYRGTGRRIYKTKETIVWEKEAFVVLSKVRHKMLKDPVYVGIDLCVRRDRDIDNIKPILDALEGRIIENDRQVVHLNVKKHVDKNEKNPRVEVFIEKIAS